ncbi:MAG: NAD(P)H-quinone oxidoreductase [Pseudomonadota bacterium]
MRVIEIARPGGPEVLRIVERGVPQPGEGEVLVRVAAAGVNRPDIQQRRGLYPPPPGTTDIPGLDVAGTVHAAGPGVQDLAVGAAVCALANGGGYADYCIVPAVQCMPVPRGLSFAEAASLPEVFFTAWNNIVWLAGLRPGETLLVHGGTSGVGMAAIQIARQLFSARVLATAGSEEKRAVCRDVGAEAAFDYRGDWDVQIRGHLSGSGVDIILDGQAGPATQRQLDLLNEDGRLVFIASHQGEFAEINMRQLVRRRLTITGSTLRPRPSDYKGRLARELVERVWPLLEDGRIATRVHAALPFEQVQAAHAILDENRQIGKVVLIVDAELGASVPRPRHAA